MQHRFRPLIESRVWTTDGSSDRDIVIRSATLITPLLVATTTATHPTASTTTSSRSDSLTSCWQLPACTQLSYLKPNCKCKSNPNPNPNPNPNRGSRRGAKLPHLLPDDGRPPIRGEDSAASWSVGVPRIPQWCSHSLAVLL